MKDGFIYIKNNIFSTLLAVTAEEQAKGLMGVEWPPPNMSFVYNRPQVNKFWMLNTISPLDILFCYNGKISQICYGEPHSTKIIGKDDLSDLVIELPYGTVKAENIQIGDQVELITAKLIK